MIVDNILGNTTLIIIAIWLFFVIKKNNSILNFLLVAFLLRSSCLLLDQYFITLPDSTADAVRYEFRAFSYSKNDGLKIIFNLFQDDSFFISRIISIFYTLLDRSPMMAKAFSVWMGVGSVYLIYKLAFELWGQRAAIKAGWVAALFPSLILYSAIILKESYIIFFFIYGLIGCVLFIKEKKISNFIQACFGLLVVSIINGAMIFGIITFLIYVLFDLVRKKNFLIYKNKILTVLLSLVILLPIYFYVTGHYAIPKYGNFEKLTDIENILNKIAFSSRNSTQFGASGAAYPEWLIPKNLEEIIYLSPIRMIYFLYSPFPWDIKRLSHLVGLLDSLLYIYLSICFWKNRKKCFQDPSLRFLILVFMISIFIYCWGVGNFGTGIRHRSKFVGILLALVAPRIIKIQFSKKN